MTPAEADALFAAMTALGDRIAFRYLREGCESRSQLMIEAMTAAGIIPGRVWALTVPGKVLRPANLPRGHTIRWLNHTAPTVAVDATPEGVRVIDPSLPGVAGPLTVAEWAAAISLRRFETPAMPLTQAEMLGRFGQSIMVGQGIDGFVFVVPLGVSPVADIAGSGFRLQADPPEGVSAFAREQMKGYLDDQALTDLDG